MSPESTEVLMEGHLLRPGKWPYKFSERYYRLTAGQLSYAVHKGRCFYRHPKIMHGPHQGEKLPLEEDRERYGFIIILSKDKNGRKTKPLTVWAHSEKDRTLWIEALQALPSVPTVVESGGKAVVQELEV